MTIEKKKTYKQYLRALTHWAVITQIVLVCFTIVFAYAPFNKVPWLSVIAAGIIFCLGIQTFQNALRRVRYKDALKFD